MVRNMVIIKLQGGFGNQMFQYALYKKLKHMGRDVALDRNEIKKEIDINSQEYIFNVFQLEHLDAKIGDIAKLKSDNHTVFDKVRFKLFGSKKTHYYEPENDRGMVQKAIYNMDNVYLDGFWQTHSYFDDIRNEIIKCYSFPEIDENNKKMLTKIANSKCSVSLHMRLGDYCNPLNQMKYGGICTTEYYKNAIRFFVEKYESPDFFVFSNDLVKAKKEVGGDYNYIFVDINDKCRGWCDMMLMSKCKHNIIANSSFSWWGAYLNQHYGKTVIAPKIWVNNREMPDVCCEEWMRL